MGKATNLPSIVSRAEWQTAHEGSMVSRTRAETAAPCWSIRRGNSCISGHALRDRSAHPLSAGLGRYQQVLSIGCATR
jgi:hypothetical protein